MRISQPMKHDIEPGSPHQVPNGRTEVPWLDGAAVSVSEHQVLVIVSRPEHQTLLRLRSFVASQYREKRTRHDDGSHLVILRSLELHALGQRAAYADALCFEVNVGPANRQNLSPPASCIRREEDCGVEPRLRRWSAESAAIKSVPAEQSCGVACQMHCSQWIPALSSADLAKDSAFFAAWRTSACGERVKTVKIFTMAGQTRAASSADETARNASLAKENAYQSRAYESFVVCEHL